MKAVLGILAAALALIWLVPDDAAAQSRGARKKATKQLTRVVERRPASVGQNGLCQRDTGTPDDKLDFRNRCDTEEYWNRTMDRGSGIGR